MTRRLAAAPDPGPAPLYAIGVRVSAVRGRSGDTFHSPETQIAASARAIEQAGGVLDTSVGERGVFFDLDVSGAVAPSDRPGLSVALRLVRDGRLSGVAVYDISRWSRDTAAGLRELEDIAGCGGTVLSAAETIDIGTPSGLFTTTVMLAAARMKRDETAKKWREVHERRHAAGQFHGRVPLGYLIEDGKAVQDPLLGPVVTWAFDAYLAGAVSQKDIAARLTAARGRLVRQGVVSNLLRNPFHAGLVMYRRERRPGQHEPLVTPEVFDAVQRKLSRELLAAPRRRVPVSFVAGLVVCDHCGHALHRRGAGRDTDGGRARLRCPTPDCGGVGAPFVDDLEQVLHERILFRAEVYDPTVEPERREVDLGPLRQAVAVARRRLQVLGQKLADEVISDDDFRLFAVDARAAVVAAETRLAEAEDAVVAQPTSQQVNDAAEQVAALWDRMTPQEQRAAAEMLLPTPRLRRAAYRGEPVADRLTYDTGDVSS